MSESTKTQKRNCEKYKSFDEAWKAWCEQRMSKLARGVPTQEIHVDKSSLRKWVPTQEDYKEFHKWMYEISKEDPSPISILYDALEEMTTRISYLYGKTDGTFEPPALQEIYEIGEEAIGTFDSIKTASASNAQVRAETCSLKDDMTIDDAIKHAQDVADSNDTPCGRQHARLAIWLQELRDIRAHAVNMAEARSALEYIATFDRKGAAGAADCVEDYLDFLDKCAQTAKKALKAKSRNCDVFTPPEMRRRFDLLCATHDICRDCPMNDVFGDRRGKDHCFAYWTQFPFEHEEGYGNDDLRQDETSNRKASR